MERASRATRPLDWLGTVFVFGFFAFYPVSAAMRGGPIPKLMVAGCIGVAAWDVVTRWAPLRIGVVEALVLAFGCWFVVSIAASTYPTLSGEMLVPVVGWTVVALAMAQLLFCSTRVWAALLGYVAGGTAAAVWALANVAMGIVPTAQIPGEDVNDTGFYTSTAAVLAIGILVTKSSPRWARILCAPAGLVAAMAVAASLSRGSLLGLALGLVVLFVRSREARGPLLKTAVAGIAVVALSSPLWMEAFQTAFKMKSHVAAGNVDSRLDAWVVGANLGGAHPLTGTGPMTISPYILAQDRIPPGAFVVHVAHNTLVEAFYGTGLVGLLLLGAATVAAFSNTNRTASVAGGAAVHEGRTGAPTLAVLTTGVACSLLTTQIVNATMWLVLIMGAAGSALPLTALLPSRTRGAHARQQAAAEGHAA